jgi:hypothetical protein
VDALGLEGERGPEALVAWRPEPPRADWVGKDRSVLVAFDPAADFGPGGRHYAQEVLEALLGVLPSGSSTAMLAYDGTVKLDPDGLSQHLPARVELMLQSLWELPGEGGAGGMGFLQRAADIVASPDNERILVFVTGREGAGRGIRLRIPEGDGSLRVAILELGADAPADAYRAFSRQTGGVALALPASQAPEMAALDFLANLRWPAWREVGFSAHGPGAGALLLGEGRFANQPVLAVVRLQPGSRSLVGRFEGRSAGQRLAREFDVSLPEGSPLRGEQIRQLAATLRAAGR